MKTLIGTMLFAATLQVHAQSLEADLDGNASALQASEMRPAPKSQSSKTNRQRVAVAR